MRCVHMLQVFKQNKLFWLALSCQHCWKYQKKLCVNKSPEPLTCRGQHNRPRSKLFMHFKKIKMDLRRVPQHLWSTACVLRITLPEPGTQYQGECEPGRCLGINVDQPPVRNVASSILGRMILFRLLLQLCRKNSLEALILIICVHSYWKLRINRFLL